MQNNIAAPLRPANPLPFFARHFFKVGMISALLLSFGGEAWMGGRVFCALILGGPLAVNLWLWRCRPELFAKRARVKTAIPVLIFAWVPLAAFLRTDWPVAALGGPLIVLAYLLIGWALASNPYAIAETALQPGQAVVQTGPYAFVRHPIYTANCLLAIGGGCLLGLGGSFIAAAGIWASIVRARKEDDMLQFGLPGYRNYAKRVRRLI